MLMVQSIGDLDTDGNRVAPPVQQADTVGAPITAPYEPETIAVVEDQYFTREGICDALRDAGWDVEAFSSCEDFLAVQESRPSPCVVLDIHFPGMGGLELLSRLSQMPNSSPVIVVSGSSAIAEAVQSMRDGALDFIEKPFVHAVLLARVKEALTRSRRPHEISAARRVALAFLPSLTRRQGQIMDLVLAGHPSKNIAIDLGISRRTVENHRAAIMKKSGARSLPDLGRRMGCNRCALDG